MDSEERYSEVVDRSTTAPLWALTTVVGGHRFSRTDGARRNDVAAGQGENLITNLELR